jgi:transcriptional regulator with XRE-family HTH domain
METTPHLTDKVTRDVGLRIRTRREALGITQVQLAEMIGTSQATVSRAEKGQVWLPTASFLRVKAALGLTDDEFQDLLRGAA